MSEGRRVSGSEMCRERERESHDMINIGSEISGQKED